MKSNQAAQRKISLASPEDAFRAFFETLETPAAVCDVGLRLLAANPAFEVLCGIREVSGQNLGEVLEGVASAVPPDGSSQDVEIQCVSGQRVALTLSRRGDTVAIIAKNTGQPSFGSSLEVAGRNLIEQARVEQALLSLGREVTGAISEEELVAVVIRGIKGLFPGRTFCLRILDPRTSALTSLYAEGSLIESAREIVFVKRSVALKAQLRLSELPNTRVKIQEGDLPHLFVGSVRAISAPLVASGDLLGAINIEYPEGVTADLVADDCILTQLAHQVEVGIRNAKLIDELTFVRRHLEDLLESANALILVIDRERKILVFNRQLVDLTGLAKNDVIGQDVLNFVPGSERLRVLRVIANSLRGESVSNFETMVLGRNGKEIKVSFATSTVLAPEGEVEGLIAIGHDLTEIKQLEQRIIHSEKLASIGQLAASVVHEINNPLSAIATYVDALLQQLPISPGVHGLDRDKLEKIRENTQRILRFTRDLTSYAKPSPAKPELLDIGETMDLAVRFSDHVLQHHKIQVVRQYEPIPKFEGVKGHLVQVFVNLITNACHAMEAGGCITLKTELAGENILIRVSDTGAGIATADLEKVFEPFFTTKPEGKGSGLGLSIVQELVERHRGDISVESEVGRGTTFSIKLPLVNVPQSISNPTHS